KQLDKQPPTPRGKQKRFNLIGKSEGAAVIPAVTYREIENHLNYSFSREGGAKKNVRMVGLLFARPGSALAKAEVLPNLEYFDRRSGRNIDFYVAGFRQGWPGLEEDDHVSRK